VLLQDDAGADAAVVGIDQGVDDVVVAEEVDLEVDRPFGRDELVEDRLAAVVGFDEDADDAGTGGGGRMGGRGSGSVKEVGAPGQDEDDEGDDDETADAEGFAAAAWAAGRAASSAAAAHAGCPLAGGVVAAARG
jgi:hypothetical protein